MPKRILLTLATILLVTACSVALAHMSLMAQEQGVGSCWVQMRMRKDSEGNDAEQNVRDILGVELPLRMVGIMALGMPAEEKEGYSLDELKWEKVHSPKQDLMVLLLWIPLKRFLIVLLKQLRSLHFLLNLLLP